MIGPQYPEQIIQTGYPLWFDWSVLSINQLVVGGRGGETIFIEGLGNLCINRTIQFLVLLFFYVWLKTSPGAQLHCKNGDWVPETSRSCHSWQPAPRWWLHPWLANPGNPAMSPHSVRGTGTLTLLKQWKGGKGGGRGTAWAMSRYYKITREMPPVQTPCYDPWACGFPTHAHGSIPLTTRGMQVLFIVNSVKLHLTARQ